MTKNPDDHVADDLRPEYDLSKLKGRVRGKYLVRATAASGKPRKRPSTKRPGEL